MAELHSMGGDVDVDEGGEGREGGWEERWEGGDGWEGMYGNDEMYDEVVKWNGCWGYNHKGICTMVMECDSVGFPF